MYVLGIDLGTSCCKTVLFQEDCQEVCSAAKEYPILIPQEGWAEEDSDHWWEAVVFTIKAVLEKARIAPSQIAGIGVDSQSSIALPIDKAGKALRPGLLWMDRRAEEQCRWIDTQLKNELWEINGNRNDPSNIAPKILWIRDNEPDVYAQTYQFLHGNGYLIFKLTGKCSMDISEGGLTQLFDTKRGCWSQELISSCGIDPGKLPEIYNCYAVVGHVTKETAQLTGLQAGTPVVAGSMDMVASALGNRVISHGQVYLAAGTVIGVGGCLDHPRFSKALHIYHHILPGMWITAAGVDFGGGGLKWFKDLLEHEAYDEIAALAQSSRPGSNGLIFLPYMVGQRSPLWNNNTRGVIFGLNPRTQKQDLTRMFMEGTAFAIRYVWDIFEQEGIEVRDIKITGGCTRMEIWPRIIADIIGKPIEISRVKDAAALGTAITAGVGVGLYRDFDEILDRFSSGENIPPNVNNQQLYDAMYALYCRLYSNLQEEFDGLAAVQQNFF